MLPRKDVRLLYCAALLLLTAAAGCGGPVDPSKNQTVTKTNTVPKGGFGPVETFSTSKTGEVSVTVTSMTPVLPSNTVFAVFYGQFISGQCATNSVNQFAVVGSAAISGSITPGSYCVFVQDEGFFASDETYTMTISHP